MFPDRSSGFMPELVEVAQNKLTVRRVDDSVNTTFICEVTNSLGTGKDQLTVLVRGECYHALIHPFEKKNNNKQTNRKLGLF